MSTAGGSGGGGGAREGARVNSAIRGAGLIGLAVVLGIVLLQVIDKGPSGGGTAASERPTSTTTPGATGTSQPATTGQGVKPRAEVRVVVYNAGQASGAAGNMTNKLRTLGYQLAPASNATPRTGTVVACKQDFEREAAQLQGDVGAGTTVEPFPNPGPAGSENVNCIVLLGR
jgi:LytR cell envelope-related transcriptional attenuator